MRRPIEMDSYERDMLRAEGRDPDDPHVIAAIDLVRWELSMLLGTPDEDS